MEVNSIGLSRCVSEGVFLKLPACSIVDLQSPGFDMQQLTDSYRLNSLDECI